MRHFLSILFGAAFTCAVSWSIGLLLFGLLRIRLKRTEHDLLAGVTGSALLSLLIFVLCAVHLARIPIFLAFGIAAIAGGWRQAKVNRSQYSEEHSSSWSRPWQWMIGLPFIFYAVVYLSNSFAPENSPDGQAYHLGLVYRYFREHGFNRLTTNMYSSLSHGVEMLFLFAFSFGRHASAATVHCCFLLAMPVLLFSYGRRIGHPYAGACAGMLVYLSPLAGIDGVSAYNDVALAVAGFSTYYLLEIWREEKGDKRNNALLIPTGILAGFCFAIKYTGYVAVAYVFFVVFVELIVRDKRINLRSLRSFGILAAMVALMTAPWLIRNWIWLGNPLSPFMNRVFPNPYIHVTFEDSYRQYFRTYDLPSLKPLFWMDTVSGIMGGQLGPIFLLAPLALLGLRKREGRHVLLAALFFFLSYPQNLGSRFLIPVLPFVAMGMALALEFSRKTQAILILLAAPLAWPGNINRYRAPAGGWQIGHVPWKAALGIIPQDKWLVTNSDGWVTARMLDEFVPDGKKVWSTSPVAESYSKTDVLVNYYSAEGELIQDILTTAIWQQFQPTLNLRYTFSPRTLNRIRMVQRGAPSSDVWSIGEMKFFLGDKELSRSPRWKFDATPFPWDIGLAFDGNPSTRWRSWEPVHPGMHVDVDFGGPLQLDRIELHSSHDEGHIDVTPLGIDARLEKVDEPPSDLRRIATATVKARGIDYLLIVGDHWLAPGMFHDPAAWGLQKIADRGNTWLFKIQ